MMFGGSIASYWPQCLKGGFTSSGRDFFAFAGIGAFKGVQQLPEGSASSFTSSYKYRDIK